MAGRNRWCFWGSLLRLRFLTESSKKTGKISLVVGGRIPRAWGMRKSLFLTIVLGAAASAFVIAQEKTPPAKEGWVSVFDGTSLKGWHVSAKTGHSGASQNKSGGKWVVKDGAIEGSQDIPGNGGLIITDEAYGDFEVSVDMNNDFGPDSGLFLRSTEDGKAWQAMIDYHSGGNLMGIYGEGLGGDPHVRNYQFKESPDDIEITDTGKHSTPLAVDKEGWKKLFQHGKWNTFRAIIVGNPPHITTFINDVKIMEWQEKEVRHPATGGIALQVHGGGDFTKQFVRYKNIKVRKITK